jgi:hypothetical protein
VSTDGTGQYRLSAAPEFAPDNDIRSLMFDTSDLGMQEKRTTAAQTWYDFRKKEKTNITDLFHRSRSAIYAEANS